MKADDQKENVDDLLDAVGKAREVAAADGLDVPVPPSPILRFEPELGEKLGDFRLIQELGRGGMGAVFEANQESLNRRVAIKMLHPGLTSSKRALSRFRREAEAVARLSHPNIIPIYAVGEQNGLHYFAMRFLVGPDLSDIIDRLREAKKSGQLEVEVDLMGRSHPETMTPTVDWKPRDPSRLKFKVSNYVYQAIELIADVADALDVAHQHGIIHRDVKPGNLVFDRTSNLILTDFGIAKTEGAISITRTGEFIGSPGYISPEQAMTKRVKVDHRSDIYSLGVTLYELLTLEQPFLQDTLEATLRAILTKDPIPPRKLNPKLPKDVETVVLKALEKDPDRRFLTAAEMSAELRRILNFEAIRVTPTSGLTRVWRVMQRNRSATMAALLVAVLGTSLVVLKNQLDKKNQEVLQRAEHIRTSSSGGVSGGVLADFVAGSGGFDEGGIARRIAKAQAALSRGDWVASQQAVSNADIQLELAVLSGDERVQKFIPSLSSAKIALIRKLSLVLRSHSNPGEIARARQALVAYLSDLDSLVVKNAAVVLGDFGGTAAVFPLSDALALWMEGERYQKTGKDMRADFVEALGKNRHPSSVNALAMLGSRPGLEVELARVRALSLIHTREAKKLLESIQLNSETARVRRFSTKALEAWDF